MRWVIFIVVAILGFALDQGTKVWAFSRPELLQAYGARIEVIPGVFDIALSENRGAAWGLFWGQHAFFMVVSAVAFLTITFFVHTAPPKSRTGPFILGLVMAGVAGNFWDRALYGAVKDFLDVHTPETGTIHDLCAKLFSGRTHWPTFNVADIFICIGAGALIIALWKEEKAKKAAEKKDEPQKDEPKKDAPASAPSGSTATS